MQAIRVVRDDGCDMRGESDNEHEASCFNCPFFATLPLPYHAQHEARVADVETGLTQLGPAPVHCEHEVPSSACTGEGRQRWDQETRTRHSRICSGIKRLGTEEKLNIILLYYNKFPCATGARTLYQNDIAKMVGKSRTAIGKVLHPNNARKVVEANMTGGFRETILANINDVQIRRERSQGARNL
eukprot:751504-Hanusia_phi.AAC.1